MAAQLLSEREIPERFVPIVLGGDTLAYSYARCFHEAYGVDTMVISSVDVRVTSSSRFVDYRVDPVMAQGEDAIVGMLGKLGERLCASGKVPMLLGSADWHVRILSHRKRELERWFVVPYNEFGLLDEITQKSRFYEICDELGIAYPKTVTLSCDSDPGLGDLDGLSFPLIAKPSNSARYDLLDFPGKEKVYRVDDLEGLKRVLRLMHGAGYAGRLIVQDLIPGGDDAIYTLTTYSIDGGEIRAVSGGRVALQDHDPRRIGNPSCILIERREQLIEDAKRFCRHVGYRAFANFDAKFDSRDGSFKFFEVNARPGANTFYMAVGGLNFTELLVEDYLLGREPPYREAYREGVYTLVPPAVVREFVTDPDLRAHVLECFREGRAVCPFSYQPDSPAHAFWSWVRWEHQRRKYRRYLAVVSS